MLTVGQPAPEFASKSTDGQVVRLSDLRGRAVVIYFFPRAFTAGCTVETNRFRDNYDELRGLGAEIIGISTDEHETQCRFAEARKVKFPMIGDASGEISKAYDVVGRFFGGDKRVTYVIDEAGLIAAVFHHELRVGLHIDEVRQFLQKRRPSQGSPRA